MKSLIKIFYIVFVFRILHNLVMLILETHSSVLSQPILGLLFLWGNFSQNFILAISLKIVILLLYVFIISLKNDNKVVFSSRQMMLMNSVLIFEFTGLFIHYILNLIISGAASGGVGPT